MIVRVPGKLSFSCWPTRSHAVISADITPYIRTPCNGARAPRTLKKKDIIVMQSDEQFGRYGYTSMGCGS